MININLCKFSRSELESIARHVAKLRLIGPSSVGNIGDQRVRWDADGSLEVITEYEYGNLPESPDPLPLPTTRALPARGRPKKSR